MNDVSFFYGFHISRVTNTADKFVYTKGIVTSQGRATWLSREKE